MGTHTDTHTCFSEKMERQLILKIYRCRVCWVGFFFTTSFSEFNPAGFNLETINSHTVLRHWF